MSASRCAVRSTLQVVCRTHPALAKEHLIVPLLTEVDTDPSRAWLLATLSPTPALATFIIPSLIVLLQRLLPSLSDCKNWENTFHISLTLVKVIKNVAKSAPLSSAWMDSLVLLSHQVSCTHWKCCSAEACRLIDYISTLLSHNARNATEG